MQNKNSHKRSVKALTLFLFLGMLAVFSLVQAQSADIRSRMAVPERIMANKLDAPIILEDGTGRAKLDEALNSAAGLQQVFIRLNEPAVGELISEDALGLPGTNAQMRVANQQDDLWEKVIALDGNATLRGRVKNTLNGIFVEVDSDVLSTLAADPAVYSINLVQDYDLYLSDTVPYIGASAVQDLGFDGSGVTVAVLDSGVDYTHANLGGGGTLADYEAAYGTSTTDPANTTNDGLFPTAKVIAGYDFVGEMWPTFGPEMPDEDPIDFEGHGTHVADIIGGLGGVAPGVNLVAVKVCSAIAPNCSGIALIQGMDFAVDPNGDGDFSDAVDVINMSLGGDYGTAFDDDLSAAVDAASNLGVLTVSSAGNCSNKPFCTGTPSSAPTALAVAQTAVPSAAQEVMEIVAPEVIAGDYFPAFQAWSAPVTEIIEAPVIYGDGNNGNLDGCALFTEDLSGKIVLVDRGGCFFSTKIQNVEAAGGLVGIIGLVAPGDPFSGGFGEGDPPQIPGFMITQYDAELIKIAILTGNEVIARFDPARSISLAGTIVGSSARGPAMGSNLLKPEIGAPGASVSAEVGTGTGETPFGGTSGASPMVAGSAALLMQAYPERSWAEIKAVLVNTAENEIYTTNAEVFGGELLPVTRIGGGEVRVDQALNSDVAMWVDETLSSAISFGFNDVSKSKLKLTQRIRVRNYTGERLTYTINADHRDATKWESLFVKIEAPDEITIKPYSDRTFVVRVTVIGNALPQWTMNAGVNGDDPTRLDDMEFSGYITLSETYPSEGDGQIHLPWHILPRKAGHIIVKNETVEINRQYEDVPAGRTVVVNRGRSLTNVSAFTLLAISEDIPEGGPGEQSPTPDIRYFGYRTTAVPAGFCGTEDSFTMEFAINTWERQTNLVPTSFQISIDTDLDGTVDYFVYNLDLDFVLSNSFGGRSVVWVEDAATGSANAFFFADHITNSSNTIMTICGDQLGMNAGNLLQPMSIQVEAIDFYYSGPGDILDPMVIAPLGEQYVGLFAHRGDNIAIGNEFELYPGLREYIYMLDFGQTTNDSDLGLLIMTNTGSQYNTEARIILPTSPE